jgi:hypothetical protein
VPGVQWVRLDGSFPSNPKVIALLADREGHRAGFVYCCSLAYCGAHGTDGFVAAGALPFVHGRKKDADLLVKHRLWLEDVGGWKVNGWAEYQVTQEALRVRSELARDAARRRWDRGA